MPTLDKIISGDKRLVVKDGALLPRQNGRELISEDEVRMLLRGHSIEDLSEVRKAYLEPDGTHSFFKNKQN